MKTKSVLIGSVLLATAAVSNLAFADGNSVDQSRNVFIDGTILGNWKPAVMSISNETPDVDKSLGVFASMVVGKTPRITPAASYVKSAEAEPASLLFTRQFQSNYRHTKS